MKNTVLIVAAIALSFGAGFYVRAAIANVSRTDASVLQKAGNIEATNAPAMKLGAFSVSLSVKDLAVSKAFYEQLGFTVLGGSMKQSYLVMKNGNALVGLFQGMFAGNILTFNPGWDESGQNVDQFDDIRAIQQKLKSHGIRLTTEADEQTTGPASLMTTDPDGNVILIDQHR